MFNLRPWLDPPRRLHPPRKLDPPRRCKGAKVLGPADPMAAMAGTGPTGKDEPPREESGTPASGTSVRSHAHSLTREPHAKPDMTIALLVAARARVLAGSAPLRCSRICPGGRSPGILGDEVPPRGVGDPVLRVAAAPTRTSRRTTRGLAVVMVPHLRSSLEKHPHLGVTPRLGRTPFPVVAPCRLDASSRPHRKRASCLLPLYVRLWSWRAPRRATSTRKRSSTAIL